MSGKISASHCAGTGMPAYGNMKPDSRICGRNVKNAICIAWNCVFASVDSKIAERQARDDEHERDEIELEQRAAHRHVRRAARRAPSTIVTCTRPIATNGSTLPSVSSHGDTGVAISISRLPRSRSRTSAIAVNSTSVIVRITPTRPGTVFSGARRCGL